MTIITTTIVNTTITITITTMTVTIAAIINKLTISINFRLPLYSTGSYFV
jgi:hypothetical protein